MNRFSYGFKSHESIHTGDDEIMTFPAMRIDEYFIVCDHIFNQEFMIHRKSSGMPDDFARDRSRLCEKLQTLSHLLILMHRYIAEEQAVLTCDVPLLGFFGFSQTLCDYSVVYRGKVNPGTR